MCVCLFVCQGFIYGFIVWFLCFKHVLKIRQVLTIYFILHNQHQPTSIKIPTDSLNLSPFTIFFYYCYYLLLLYVMIFLIGQWHYVSLKPKFILVSGLGRFRAVGWARTSLLWSRVLFFYYRWDLQGCVKFKSMHVRMLSHWWRILKSFNHPVHCIIVFSSLGWLGAHLILMFFFFFF